MLFLCARTPNMLQPFVSFGCSVSLLLPYDVCITPSLKLSGSLLYGSHGTTAVGQKLVWSTAMRVLTLHMRGCHVGVL